MYLYLSGINCSMLQFQLTGGCAGAGPFLPAGHSILASARRCHGVSIQHWWQQCSSKIGARLLCLAAFVGSGKHGHALLGDVDTLGMCLYDSALTVTVGLQIVPLSTYVIEVQYSSDSGTGLAGATFFTGSGQKLSAQGIRLSSVASSVQRGTLVAPPGSYFAALWIGNWRAERLQVTACCPPTTHDNGDPAAC